MNAKTVEEGALCFSVQELVGVSGRLFRCLDDLRDRDVEALWLDTAEHRAKEIGHGSIEFVTPEELVRRVKARLA
jgi:hypothetical protein